ncbi:hypothetical protein AALD01_15085 [Oscillospiraceae bacterium 21-37]
MVHYEGGVEVELRYFLGGVGIFTKQNQRALSLRRAKKKQETSFKIPCRVAPPVGGCYSVLKD